jgi:hypothetical protein
LRRRNVVAKRRSVGDKKPKTDAVQTRPRRRLCDLLRKITGGRKPKPSTGPRMWNA